MGNDNIELRSYNVRRFIGRIPPRLIRVGNVIIFSVILALLIACHEIRYPINIESHGIVTVDKKLYLMVPYCYLYLFDEPRIARIDIEGVEGNETVTLHRQNDGVICRDEKNFFAAVAPLIKIEGHDAKPYQKVNAEILISDKTLWQLLFKE